MSWMVWSHRPLPFCPYPLAGIASQLGSLAGGRDVGAVIVKKSRGAFWVVTSITLEIFPKDPYKNKKN